MKIVIISDLHANYDSLISLPKAYDEPWHLGIHAHRKAIVSGERFY